MIILIYTFRVRAKLKDQYMEGAQPLRYKSVGCYC